MNQSVRNKMEQLKKMATAQKVGGPTIGAHKSGTPDSLSSAIHSKRDADIFMAELRAIVKQAE